MPQAGPAVDLFEDDIEDDIEDDADDGYDAPPRMRFSAPAAPPGFGRARYAPPQRRDNAAAVFAAIVAGALIVVGGLVALTVWLAVKYGGEPDLAVSGESDGGRRAASSSPSPDGVASGTPYEKVVDDMVTSIEEMNEVLPGVVDDATAQQAAGRIVAPWSKFLAALEQIITLPPPPPDVDRDLERRHSARLNAAGARFKAEMDRLTPAFSGYAMPIAVAIAQGVSQHPRLRDAFNSNTAPRWGAFGGGMPMPIPAPPPSGPTYGRPGWRPNGDSSTPPAGYGPSGDRRPQSGYYGTAGGPNAKSPGYGPSSDRNKGGTSKGYGTMTPGADTPGYSPSKPGAGYGTSGGYGNSAPGPNTPGYGPR
jgi:hypothetical protein